MYSQKQFTFEINQNTTWDTDWFIMDVSGGTRWEVITLVQLFNFDGTSNINSGSISFKLTSNSDTSGSYVSDGHDIDINLGHIYIANDFPWQGTIGWQGVGPWPTNWFPSGSSEFIVPSRGRSIYLKLTQPNPMFDLQATFGYRVEMSFNQT
jgi:hypothetical protein